MPPLAAPAAQLRQVKVLAAVQVAARGQYILRLVLPAGQAYLVKVTQEDQILL
jgi:hypothetical protein